MTYMYYTLNWIISYNDNLNLNYNYVTLDSNFSKKKKLNQNPSSNHLTKSNKLFKLHIKLKIQKLSHDP